MTQNPDVSRGRPPAPGGGAHAARGRPRFRGKAWLLLCLPVGLTTWAAFLYIGIRARRHRWLAWAGVYLAGSSCGWCWTRRLTRAAPRRGSPRPWHWPPTVDGLRDTVIFLKD